MNNPGVKDMYYAGTVYAGVNMIEFSKCETIQEKEKYLLKFPQLVCFEPPFEDWQDVTGLYVKEPMHSPDFAGGNPTWAAVPLPKYTRVIPAGTEITSKLIYQTLKDIDSRGN